MSPKDLFNNYGTHFIVSAYLGGIAEFTSQSIITEKTSEQDIKTAVDAKYVGFKGNAELSKINSEVLKNAETKTKLRVRGGDSEHYKDIKEKNEYQLWVERIKEFPILCAFEKGKNGGRNSLRPIWSLCEDKERIDQLKKEYDKLCTEYPLTILEPPSVVPFDTSTYYSIRDYNEKFTLAYHNKVDKPYMGDKYVLVDPHNTSCEWKFEQCKYFQEEDVYWIIHRDTGKLLSHYTSDEVYAGDPWVKDHPGDNYGRSSLWLIKKANAHKDAYYIQHFKRGKHLSWYSYHDVYVGDKDEGSEGDKKQNYSSVWILHKLGNIQ
jgi:hypothetical protein